MHAGTTLVTCGHATFQRKNGYYRTLSLLAYPCVRCTALIEAWCGATLDNDNPAGGQIHAPLASGDRAALSKGSLLAPCALLYGMRAQKAEAVCCRQ